MARPGSEAGLVIRCLSARECQNVCLQRRKAAHSRFAAQRDNVVEGSHRSRAEEIGMAHAQGPAMRPIGRQTIAHCPSEEVIDWYSQRFRLEIETGVLDGGDGLRDHAAGGSSGVCIKLGADLSNLTRVLSNQLLGHLSDYGRQPGNRSTFTEFGPAHQAGVRCHLQKRKRAPPGTGVYILDGRYLHGLALLPRKEMRVPRCGLYVGRDQHVWSLVNEGEAYTAYYSTLA